MPQITEILQKYFGYNSFRKGQEEIINSIISGNNVLAVLPTGGGKSICYQVPAILGEKFSIVISPLIALMKDQADSLNQKEKIAGVINSSISYGETEEIFREIISGKIKIIYVSPEKLENSEFAKKIKALSPEYLFIDEAHCISQWGHNFRPSYTKIIQFAEFIGVKKISSFTATATPLVREDIIRQLKLENPKIFIQGFERENLSINVFVTKFKKEKTSEILTNNRTPAIIYTATRKNAEELVEFLRHKNIQSQFYHAGMAPELRRIIQDDFISGRIKIIVATNAFGMGIDKSDIRTIVHYNMPGSIESYYQEIGRAGRDGNESRVFLLYDLKDTEIQNFFVENSYPRKDEIEYIYDLIHDHGKVAVGSRPDKVIRFDENTEARINLKRISASKLNAITRVLEESGYIKMDSNFHKNHFVRFILSQSDLKEYLKKISNDFNKEILVTILREYGNTLFDSKTIIDLEKISRSTQSNEKQIISILENLHRIGILEYDKPSNFSSVKILEPRVLLKNLKINYSTLTEMMKFEKEKLQSMVDFVFTTECRFNYILNYFGEQLNNFKCGKCDVCSGASINENITNEYIEEIILQAIINARHPYKEKSLLKILMGNSKSPQIRSNSFFGKCANYKKDEVESSINSLISKGEIQKSIDTLVLSENRIEKFLEIEDPGPVIINDNDYEKTLILFNKLREARKNAAVKYSQNANLICRDELLRLIARERPVTPSAFLEIEGTNQRLFNKIGEEFIEIIKEESDKTKIGEKHVPDNIVKTLELINKKYSLSDICSLTKLPEAVLSMQIETILEYYPDTNILSLIPKNELELIKSEINNGITDLKELKNMLPNSISYGKIRIVLAKQRVK
ncbi:MAG: RecQ family ATP-dependent DNA helicase [Bacteroidetes bacterium]|nr:RecQ family ATP-dependent DNA helicase [Bacteroidota bacterium]